MQQMSGQIVPNVHFLPDTISMHEIRHITSFHPKLEVGCMLIILTCS
jgi:hypothetical protein